MSVELYVRAQCLPSIPHMQEDNEVVEDKNWKLDAAGRPGQQLSLLLLMRVVADVGIVGLPNAGGCVAFFLLLYLFLYASLLTNVAGMGPNLADAPLLPL